MATITATVRDGNGDPVEGARIIVGETQSRHRTTGANGQVTWSVASSYEASINYTIIRPDGTEGEGRRTYVKAGDSIEFDI